MTSANMNKPDPTAHRYPMVVFDQHAGRFSVDLDNDRSVVFYFTDEGLIIDAWSFSGDEGTPLGTFSQTYEEIIDNLLK